jgi:heme/copper-type cytochrome/quinol oxidase subunit 2
LSVRALSKRFYPARIAGRRLVSRNTLVLVVVIIAALVGSGAYYAQTISSANNAANTITIDITIVGGIPGTPNANTTDTYSPDSFTVTKGEHVNLAVLNTDDNTHGLAIPQFKVDTGIIPPGNTFRLSFVADQTGTFQYYEPAGYCGSGVGNVCNSAQHMTGNMTVLP